MRPAVGKADKKREKKTKEQREQEEEEHARMLRKEQLMREIKLGALTTKRYRTLWREMMMRIKMPQIIEDVEVAWRNFDRALDIKDYRISLLMDELAEAEEQYQRNVRSHIETIDRLLRSYKKKMEREEQNYRATLNEKLDQKDIEVNKICHQQNENEIFLQLVTHNVQQQLKESLNNLKSIALSKIDAFVADSKDIRRFSATQLENQLRSFWEELRQVLSDYQNKTKDRRNHYEPLKEKDGKDQQVIAQQLLRTASLFEEIQKFRSKITTYDAATNREISEILAEYDFFQKVYWTVKNRFLFEQAKDKEQLKILSIEYNKTIKHLERLVNKGKRLLTLMQICRKYETQYEKILPFVESAEDSTTSTSHQNATPPDIRDVSHQVNFVFRNMCIHL
ncbi:dynein regulatory complex subunit 2-like [Linepithema humile]|uniref:dynein regulatory complex subunit 2-like n=1 Tax=Linepithema humile TaxID=83485 RepID=UPI00351DAE9E